MDKRRRIVLNLSFLILAFSLFIYSLQNRINKNAESDMHQRVQVLEKKTQATEQRQPALEKQVKTRRIVKKTKSLDQMARILARYAQPSVSLKELIVDLQEQGPVVARQANPYTGELLMIRTKKPLPGTRYFHAQYYSEERSGSHFMQHMSFEFKPGAQSMNQAIASVQTAFSSLGKPLRQNGDFISWTVNENYTLWIKRMGKEELSQPDPFNAYSASDLGTIQVALELKVHEEG